MFNKRCATCKYKIKDDNAYYYSCGHIHCSKYCSMITYKKVLKEDNYLQYPQFWNIYILKNNYP